MTVTPTAADAVRGPEVRRPDLRRLGFGPDAVAYQDAWDEQRRVLDAVVDALALPRDDATVAPPTV